MKPIDYAIAEGPEVEIDKVTVGGQCFAVGDEVEVTTSRGVTMAAIVRKVRGQKPEPARDKLREDLRAADLERQEGIRRERATWRRR